jgi:putative DNA primase/helicase
MIDYALQYAARGWRIFPVGLDKKPLIKWKAGATVSPSKIESYWYKWPDANIAIATGRPSGVYVIDIDSYEALQRFIKAWGSAWAEAPPPALACVRTGRGIHIYLMLEQGHEIPCSTGPKGSPLEGIDVRGEGGYVLAPPSVHSSGRIYRWDFSLIDGSAHPPLFQMTEGDFLGLPVTLWYMGPSS